jgi:hypothetical protein
MILFDDNKLRGSIYRDKYFAILDEIKRLKAKNTFLDLLAANKLFIELTNLFNESSKNYEKYYLPNLETFNLLKSKFSNNIDKISSLNSFESKINEIEAKLNNLNYNLSESITEEIIGLRDEILNIILKYKNLQEGIKRLTTKISNCELRDKTEFEDQLKKIISIEEVINLEKKVDNYNNCLASHKKHIEDFFIEINSIKNDVWNEDIEKWEKESIAFRLNLNDKDLPTKWLNLNPTEKSEKIAKKSKDVYDFRIILGLNKKFNKKLKLIEKNPSYSKDLVNLKKEFTNYKLRKKLFKWGIFILIICCLIYLFNNKNKFFKKDKTQAIERIVILDDLNGSSIGNSFGIKFKKTPTGQGAVFSRKSESRIEYPFSQGLPRQGTIEILINVSSGYGYDKFKLSKNLQYATIFTTVASDAWYNGAMWLTVENTGNITLTTGLSSTPTSHSLNAQNTSFRFNEWHVVSFSYGTEGQFIRLDGQNVASNNSYTEQMDACGKLTGQKDNPTIGEGNSIIWKNNEYDSGFEGIVDCFRASNIQQDWVLKQK